VNHLNKDAPRHFTCSERLVEALNWLDNLAVTGLAVTGLAVTVIVKNGLFKRSLVVLPTVVCVLLVGCQSETATVSPSTPKTQDAAPIKEEQTSQSVTASDVQIEQLTQEPFGYQEDVAGVTQGSSPAQVCEAFVRTLHHRDTISCERLLTLASRIVIHESGLELGPLAGQNAQYVIGEAKYATNREELAYVDCHVFDPDEGEEGKFVVTWMLKQESSYGWRVCGMIMAENNESHVVNFESSTHAQAINQMYNEEKTSDAAEVRQASGATNLEIPR